MKTKEELNALKEEVKALNAKLAELSEEELEQVTGGRHNIRTPLSSDGSDPSAETLQKYKDEMMK